MLKNREIRKKFRIALSKMSGNTAKMKKHKEFALNLVEFAYSLLSFHLFLLYLRSNHILIRYDLSASALSRKLVQKTVTI